MNTFICDGFEDGFNFMPFGLELQFAFGHLVNVCRYQCDDIADYLHILFVNKTF